MDYKTLKAEGLFTNQNLCIKADKIKIRFEPPSQLNERELYIYQNINIGRYTYIGSGILRHVKFIGRYCSIAKNVTIGESEHPTHWLSTSPATYSKKIYNWYKNEEFLSKERAVRPTKENLLNMPTQDVHIGNDVWIGGGASIRRGVKIGDGAIVAGGAFVIHDVPPYAIVGGVPAKILKYRFPQHIIDELLEIKWWHYDINDLAGVSFDDIQKSIVQIKQLISENKIQKAGTNYKTVTISKDNKIEIL